MYPPSPYAASRGSFQTKVTPPVSHPLDQPLYQLCINKDWLPYIAGALKQLELESTWVVADDNELLTVQGKVFDLISEFGLINEGCGSVAPGMLCISGSFKDDQYGFVPQVGVAPVAVWSAGTGWQGTTNLSTSFDEIHIGRLFDQATYIRSASYTWHVDIPHGASYKLTFKSKGTITFTQTFTTGSGGDIVANFTVNQPADEMLIDIVVTSGVGAEHLRLTDWSLCYTGAFPLALPPHPSCRLFDFLTNQSTFVVWTERPYGSWASGTGWSSQPNQIGKSSIYIGRHFDYAGVLGSVTVHGHFGATPNQLTITNEFINQLNVTGFAVGDFTYTFQNIGWPVDGSQRMLINALYTGGGSPGDTAMRIYDVEACGSPGLFA